MFKLCFVSIEIEKFFDIWNIFFQFQSNVTHDFENKNQ